MRYLETRNAVTVWHHVRCTGCESQSYRLKGKVSRDTGLSHVKHTLLLDLCTSYATILCTYHRPCGNFAVIFKFSNPSLGMTQRQTEHQRNSLLNGARETIRISASQNI